jgi:1,4-dihydroxy-2-naphthoate octaprenyltransferase
MPRAKDEAISVLLHLRLPFAFFLAPIYLFALIAAGAEPRRAVEVFIVFHFLLYPASNAFNSYYDRDEGPIGALAKPPPVTKSLLVTALALDALALALGFWVGPILGMAALVYGTGSKLYSWDRTRLKARPIAGWLATGLGQGAFTFVAMAASMHNGGFAALPRSVWWGAAFESLFLLGVFPLTQVYQHEEDAMRGDLTMSRMVGLRGTFVLAAGFLGAGALGMAAWFWRFSPPPWAALFLAAQAPSAAFLAAWAIRAFRDPRAADFRSAMIMNTLASGALNLFFGAYFILR